MNPTLNFIDKLDGISYKKQKKSDQNETEFALNMEEYMSSLNDAENSNKKHVRSIIKIF